MNRRERIAKLVTETRRQQGLPDRVSDPAVLAQVAAMLRAQGVDHEPAA